MPKSLLNGVTIGELTAETWRGVNAKEDRILGRAAELAYYFMLALFPMLIFMTSLVGFIQGLREEIFRALAVLVPGEAMGIVSQTINDVTRNRSGGLISFGVLGTLWAASGGVSAVMETLNVAYKVNEERSLWKTRLLALGLTILLSILIVGGTVLIMFGDRFSTWLAAKYGLGIGFAVAWSIVDYLMALAELFLGLQLMYYFGPNVKQKWEWITPGSIFAVFSLIVASLLFSLYLRVAPNYSATYGSLGAVVVLMLWLYIAGAVILIGGEINSALARLTNKPIIPKETAAQEVPEQRRKNHGRETGEETLTTAANPGSPAGSRI